MKSKLLIVAATAGLLLAAAAPALADEGTAFAQADVSGSANVQDKGGSNLGSFIGAHLGLDQKDGDDNGTSTDNDNDGHHVATSTIMKVRPPVTGGFITSIDGSTFTVAGKGSTTTVTTDSATVFKAKGGATTSAALSVGERVAVVGTTTASSSVGDSVTASLVALIGKGLAHLRFWMWFK